jgi:hypothetical protein
VRPFLLITAGLAAALLFPASPAGGRDLAWWEQCEELPSDRVEACFYDHNGEAEPGERPPAEPGSPIRERIRHRFPQSHAIFINCPGNNRIGDYQRLCEFRFISRRQVVKGTAGLEAEGESWSRTAWWLTGFQTQPPAPLRWRNCRFRRHSAGFPEPVRLSALGVACPEARELATRIGYSDVSPTSLRLPHRFTEGEWQTNTLGFVAARYRCRGYVQVRPSNPNPYGRETAKCRTRFGDRVTFVFDQGS